MAVGRSGGAPSMAYVLLNHASPEQVQRLVSSIRRLSPQAHVLVAHDERRSPAPAQLGPGVDVWTHGLATDWGSWELVEASLLALERAARTTDATWFTLISGHDYPARNLMEWERLLFRSVGGWVGTARPLRYAPRWGSTLGQGDDDLTRYTYTWFHLRIPPWARLSGRAASAADRIANAVFLRIEPLASRRIVGRGRGTFVGLRRLRNPFDGGHPCVKGSQWLAMDRDHLELVLSTLAPGTMLRRVFERSIIPDEAAMQSVLYSGGHRLDLPPVTHVSWLPDGTVRTLALDDLPQVRDSGSPFCRKVDLAWSAELLDALDTATGAGVAVPLD